LQKKVSDFRIKCKNNDKYMFTEKELDQLHSNIAKEVERLNG
jgi:hypothetical protein